jgi:hypothetical protein
MVKNDARDCQVITHALSLIRATSRLTSRRSSRATQTYWNKNVYFQQGNLNLLMIYWLKNLIDLVRMHPAL